MPSVGQPVDELRPGPALGRTQHDHGPAGPCGHPLFPGGALDGGHPLDHRVEGGRHELVHLGRVVARHPVHLVAVAFEQRGQLVVAYAGQHGRVGDLVAVQVQDGQHGAVGDRVEELVAVPTRRQRPRLGFAVADYAADEQVRVVESGAVGVREGVTELPAFVDRARRLRRHVRRDPAREAELAEQLAQALRVPGYVGVHLGVGPLEIGVGDRRRTAVARAHHVDGVEVPVADDPVHVGVDEVEAGRRAPVPEQPGLHVRRPRGARAPGGCPGGRSARPRRSWPPASRRRSAGPPARKGARRPATGPQWG